MFWINAILKYSPGLDCRSLDLVREQQIHVSTNIYIRKKNWLVGSTMYPLRFIRLATFTESSSKYIHFIQHFCILILSFSCFPIDIFLDFMYETYAKPTCTHPSPFTESIFLHACQLFPAWSLAFCISTWKTNLSCSSETGCIHVHHQHFNKFQQAFKYYPTSN